MFPFHEKQVQLLWFSPFSAAAECTNYALICVFLSSAVLEIGVWEGNSHGVSHGLGRGLTWMRHVL